MKMNELDWTLFANQVADQVVEKLADRLIEGLTMNILDDVEDNQQRELVARCVDFDALSCGEKYALIQDLLDTRIRHAPEGARP